MLHLTMLALTETARHYDQRLSPSLTADATRNAALQRDLAGLREDARAARTRDRAANERGLLARLRFALGRGQASYR